MKKLLLFAFAVFAFAACTQNDVEELSANRADVPETLTVGFEGGDDTRIQLNEAQKTVWTKDDIVSVFYRSNANQKWQYQGETGERVGNLKRVDAGTATESMKRVVVVYPYNENYYINTDTYNVQATLPATQHYLANSYGTDGNIMVSLSEYNQFSLKSVCGWLKLQLTGDGEVVKSIKFRGNDDEQVAGELYINSADATAMLASDMGGTDDNNAGGNLVFDDTILTEVVLDCGEGVELGAEATPFYISLPPQTFANGFTVDIECEDYELMTLTTEKELVIERNHIQPMESVVFEAQEIIPYNEIRYTATAKVEAPSYNPWSFDTFGANVVSNEWDSESGEGVITFDADVTTIGNYAFLYCSSLTSVTIPDSVTTIGDDAFNRCGTLTSITIPDSVTTIGNYAFYGCTSLTSVTIPDSVTTIGEEAFAWCSSLTSITIPDSVTTIGGGAFWYCSSLTSVYCKATTPPSLGESYVFDDNASERKIYVPAASVEAYKTAERWSKYADYIIGYDFENGVVVEPEVSINNVIHYTATAKVEEDSYYPWSFDTFGANVVSNEWDSESGEGVITFDADVTTIGNNAFYNCDSLTSVTIPDSVTTIGNYAFQYCNSLTSITIPDSVMMIRNSAFRDCDSLTSVTIPDSVTTIGNNAFYHCNSLIEFNGKFASEDGRCLIVDGTLNSFAPAGLTSYTIPDSVTTIGDSAFSGCGLTSITIPDSVTTIGEYAFYDCDSLTSVIIPDSVTTIGYEAFYSCDSLTSITIPDSVTTIGEEAFAWCSSLTSITIPDSVTTIGGGAFWYCSSLASVYCEATTPPSLGGSYVFDDNASGRKIYVPAASVEAYKAAEYWSKYASYIVGYDFE